MYCLSSVSGGAVSYLRNLIPLLSRQFADSPGCHQLKILAHESQREILSFLSDTQSIWIGGPRLTGWQRIVWEQKNITQIARETNADVLFTPYQIGPRVRGVKQVLMFRNMEPFLYTTYRYSLRMWFRNFLLHRQSSYALHGASRVIAVSQFAQEQLSHELGIAASKIRQIYHGRDISFSPAGSMAEDLDMLSSIGINGDFLLACGSLLPYRRCEDVIAAFNQCADDLPAKIQLIIAGSGTDRRYGKLIQQMIKNSPYCDRIIALGHVPIDVIALYRICSVCVIATEIEACPNIAIEAMTAGCVIISSNKQPLPEMFQNASIEYCSRDIIHLAKQIRRCVLDQDLRHEMKARALRRAEEFSWEKCARETYSALIDWK